MQRCEESISAFQHPCALLSAAWQWLHYLRKSFYFNVYSDCYYSTIVWKLQKVIIIFNNIIFLTLWLSFLFSYHSLTCIRLDSDTRNRILQRLMMLNLLFHTEATAGIETESNLWGAEQNVCIINICNNHKSIKS